MLKQAKQVVIITHFFHMHQGTILKIAIPNPTKRQKSPKLYKKPLQGKRLKKTGDYATFAILKQLRGGDFWD